MKITKQLAYINFINEEKLMEFLYNLHEVHVVLFMLWLYYRSEHYVLKI